MTETPIYDQLVLDHFKATLPAEPKPVGRRAQARQSWWTRFKAWAVS